MSCVNSLDRLLRFSEGWEIQKGENRENKKEENSAGEDDEYIPFGVVVGPSGTGKTLLMREVCNESPTGVLYMEVFDPSSCVEELAKATGMVTSPQNLVNISALRCPSGFS